MTIELHTEKGFPFGKNIHFAYDVEAATIVFLDPSLHWACPPSEQDDPIAAISSKVQPEELSLLSKACRELIAGTAQGSLSFCLQHAHGPRWLRVTPITVFQQGRKFMLGTVTDITAEVSNTQTAIRYADKKDSILHMLAHDLRGPLGVGRSVLKSMGPQLEDTVLVKKTENIVSILENAISMINDLLAREFLETTEVMLSKKRIDMVTKIGAYVQECRRSASITDRVFEFSTNAPSIFLPLDEAKFMQVINNLISNALKFTEPGGKISIELTDSESSVEIRFSDDGIGIPPGLMPGLFRKFTTSRRPGLMGEPTVGLGMSIIDTIIRWHNGSIRCESQEGKGTTFFISLPK
jgi:two-component system sensor histidine kinase VicK